MARPGNLFLNSRAQKATGWSQLLGQTRHHRCMTDVPRSASQPSEETAGPVTASGVVSLNIATAAEDVQATFCATLVDEWERSGVTDAVVSPGSRSTPLALALVRSRTVRTHVVLDERSAGFFAIGIARATKRPVVLLCTSGTAAVEFHAAVAEADLDRVPLVVCTADRPAELHGIGAAQTVDQQRLFGPSTRWFVDLGVPCFANVGAWRSVAARLVLEATSGGRGPGPVQINLPFREPLVGRTMALPIGRADGRPWHEHLNSTGLSESVATSIADRLNGRRGVIVAGACAGDADEVVRLAVALGWPVLADPRSGLRVPNDATIAYPDAILRHHDWAIRHRPEVVVRLGAPWASKVVGAWLSDVKDDVLVDPYWSWLDPSRSAVVHVQADPTEFCRGLLRTELKSCAPNWLQSWRDAESHAAATFDEMLDSDHALDGSPVDPAIARTVASGLPAGSQLVISSSMPVRDVEWFSAPRTGVDVHSNRGANGIDGVVSTVAGVSMNGRPTVGLLGDLAFLHDIGGLVSAKATEATPVYVVVDNAGGAIFEFLSQASLVERFEFERLFGTPQPVDIASIVRGFEVPIVVVSTVRQLASAIVDRLTARVLSVILIRTERPSTVDVHARLNAEVQRRMSEV